MLDDDEQIHDVLRAVPGIDARAIIDRLDDPEIAQEYERDRKESRTAAGTPAELQGKTSTFDGPVRFTAPSLVFKRDRRRSVAGGWQPILAYDVLIANLDPTLRRMPPPETPEPLLEHFSEGLTTAETAAILTEGRTMFRILREPSERCCSSWRTAWRYGCRLAPGCTLALGAVGRRGRNPGSFGRDCQSLSRPGRSADGRTWDRISRVKQRQELRRAAAS